MPTVIINGKRYISVSDAASKFNVSKAWMAKLCRDQGDEIGAVQLTAMWLVPEAWEYVPRKRGRPQKEEIAQ